MVIRFSYVRMCMYVQCETSICNLEALNNFDRYQKVIPIQFQSRIALHPKNVWISYWEK